MMKQSVLILQVGTLLLALSLSPAHAQQWQSTSTHTPLIELFTSQGCSSCPPADRWLSGLQGHPGLWKQFVPIARHVDYWDRLGWPDPFADPQHGTKQRHYAAQKAASGVYTPGFFIAGREWRGWFNGEQLPNRFPHLSNGHRLRITLKGSEGTLRYSSIDDPSLVQEARVSPLTGHIALLAMDQRTRIARGENAGRTLTHDFVAMDIQSLTALKPNHSTPFTLDQACTTPGRLAIAAWLESPEQPGTVQSVGGWLNRADVCGTP